MWVINRNGWAPRDNTHMHVFAALLLFTNSGMYFHFSDRKKRKVGTMSRTESSDYTAVEIRTENIVSCFSILETVNASAYNKKKKESNCLY